MAYPTSDTDVRTTAIAALIAAGTLAGDRIEDSRTAPYKSGPDDDETYPRMTVSTPRSGAENQSIGTMRIKKTTNLVVAATVRAAPDSDDTCGDVDAALAAALDTIEGQILHALVPWAAEFDSVSPRDVIKGRLPEGDAYLGQVVVVLECEWQYQITWPEIPASLATIGIDIDLAVPAGGPDGRVESSRELDLTE